MKRIGVEGASAAPADLDVGDVQVDRAEAEPGAGTEAGAAALAAERPRGPSLASAGMFIVLTLGLFVATVGVAAVVGLALAVWPAALIVALSEGAGAARMAVLGGALAAPLGSAWLVQRSWRAFADARAGRCADYMLVALVASIALYLTLVGPPVI